MVALGHVHARSHAGWRFGRICKKQMPILMLTRGGGGGIAKRRRHANPKF